MKSLIAMDVNYFFTRPGDTLSPLAEVILTASEPVRGFGKDGVLAEQDKVDGFAFFATPNSLRLLARKFLECADEADGMLKDALAAKPSEEKAA